MEKRNLLVITPSVGPSYWLAGFGLFLPLMFRLLSGPTANISFFMLAAYATLGRAQAIQALAMSWLLTMISPGIAPTASFASVGRYAVFFAAFISVFLRSGILSGQLKLNKLVLTIIVLGTLFVVHSMLISPIPDVSILKAVSWALVTGTLFSAWSGLTDAGRQILFRSLYLGLVAIMLISIPLFVLPLGYLRNGSGFQGILNHPQAFGPTMAVLGAIAGSKLFAESKPSWHYLGVFGLSMFFIMASEARTAGIAVVIGLMAAIVSAPFLTGKRVGTVLPGLQSRRVWGIACVFLALGVIFAPYISEKVGHYISKSGRAGSTVSLTEAYDYSRGKLIDQMISNINENYLAGIGFGIASDPSQMEVERDPLFGLPVSASIEKGVLPLAIIEELGVPASIIIFLWLFWLVRRAALIGISSLVLITTSLLINMGENIFFSPGGLGMLILIAFTWACTKPKDDLRAIDKLD